MIRLIGFCFRQVRNVWLAFMAAWLLVLSFHACGCVTKPETKRASADLQKRTFGSPVKTKVSPPVRHE